MELRVLRYFLAVAREENITKAAALLHLTQPTLSRQLMQLEEELGVQLFHRSRYHIVLTDEGMLLRRRAQELVDLADKTAREFTMRKAGVAGGNRHWCRGDPEYDLALTRHRFFPRTLSQGHLPNFQWQR